MNIDIGDRIWITNKEMEPKQARITDVSRYGRFSFLLRIDPFDWSGGYLEVFKIIGNFSVDHISRNDNLAIFETKPEADEYYQNL